MVPFTFYPHQGGGTAVFRYGEHGLSGLRLVDKGGKSDHDHDTGNDRHESLTGHCDGTVRELQSRDRYDRGKGLCVGSEIRGERRSVISS